MERVSLSQGSVDVEDQAGKETVAKVERKLTDFASGSEVRWCPGCGNYSILQQVKRTLAAIGADPDNTAFISGIGCSSRFPYYMSTYGMHGIHGRAIAIATGLKLARPDVAVWVVTGDGDCMSIGGNHMIHALRRNIDLKIIMFNNQIYGLTKGQASPTSAPGLITPTTPYGVVEQPFSPMTLALGSEATFIARTIDANPKHLQSVLEKAAAHKGAAFVEVAQNCVIFNDGCYDHMTNKETRDDNILELVHGKPMVFGKNHDRGIRLNKALQLEVVTLGENGVTEGDLLVHDENAESPTLAFLLSQMHAPVFPEPIGVFRSVSRATADDLLQDQIDQLRAQKGPIDLQNVLNGSETWTIS